MTTWPIFVGSKMVGFSPFHVYGRNSIGPYDPVFSGVAIQAVPRDIEAACAGPVAAINPNAAERSA
jgi:hypothetical protein